MKSAIVIGGSMGGLLAARVLTEKFEKVTIIDRDRFPAVGEHRKGVPQSRHTHGLLASGANALEDLFPGLRQELIAAGAVPGDIVYKGRWFFQGGYIRQTHSGMEAIALSRPLLEGMVRRRVLDLERIEVMEDCEVAGLLAAEDNRLVAGVRLKDGRTLAADLVVNASGRASHGPEWLEALGYAKPELERVEVALAYTTRLFRRAGTELNGDISVIVPPTPLGKRGGVMVAQEGGRWTVTLISHFGEAAPMDIEGFREFARTLPGPDIHRVIAQAEPVGDAQTARFPASQRLRYEKLTRFPQGYLVFGDAICSFNPIYGQGMSVAALESLALRKWLANPTTAAAFFGEAAKVVDIPWSIAVGNDLRMPEVKGPRPLPVRVINWYMAKLHRAAHTDSELSLAFHRVGNLLAPPPSLFHPRLLWRVFSAANQNGGAAHHDDAAVGGLVSHTRGRQVADHHAR